MKQVTIKVPQSVRDDMKLLAKQDNRTMVSWLRSTIDKELGEKSRLPIPKELYMATKDGKAYPGDIIYNYKESGSLPIKIMAIAPRMIEDPKGLLEGGMVVFSDHTYCYALGGYAWQCSLVPPRSGLHIKEIKDLLARGVDPIKLVTTDEGKKMFTKAMAEIEADPSQLNKYMAELAEYKAIEDGIE